MGNGTKYLIGGAPTVEGDHTWPQGFVVEGVNQLPHLIAGDIPQDAKVRTGFITESEPDRMREVIFARGIWDDAARYSGAAKKKELAWITRYDAWLREQAVSRGFPVVAMRKDDEDLARVVEAQRLP